MINVLLCLLFAVSGFGSRAWAYSEMIRHGYVNCTSCHVSPAGGGALTSYGRQLSGELMSTWAAENEGEVLHSALNKSGIERPEWLNFGGDLRAVQLFRSTPQVNAARFILMQADFEVALTFDKWTGVASMGGYMQAAQSRRHYLNYRPTDELSIRAGKFQQAFGLLLPDHTSTTRKALGWDEGSETYNVEAAWLGERFTGYLTAIMGRPDDPSLAREKGVSVRPAINLGDRFQVGMSYFHGIKAGQKRDVGGAFASLGFTSRLFLLTELDFQRAKLDGSDATLGLMNFQRLGYDLVQGFNFYLTQGLARSDFKNSRTAFSSYGVGSQFFPRPHFELSMEYQKQKTPSFPSRFSNYLVFLAHYHI